MVVRAGLTLAVALSAPAKAAGPIPGPVAALVERVVDGDTVRVSAEIWVDQTVAVSVRLDGVDAPELYRPQCAAEKEKAREAKAFVEDILADGEALLRDVVHDKYGGRGVAKIETNPGGGVGAALNEAGLAVPYGARDPWCG